MQVFLSSFYLEKELVENYDISENVSFCVILGLFDTSTTDKLLLTMKRSPRFLARKKLWSYKQWFQKDRGSFVHVIITMRENFQRESYAKIQLERQGPPCNLIYSQTLRKYLK